MVRIKLRELFKLQYKRKVTLISFDFNWLLQIKITRLRDVIAELSTTLIPYRQLSSPLSPDFNFHTDT